MLGKSVSCLGLRSRKLVYTKSKFRPPDSTHANGPSLVRNQRSWAGEKWVKGRFLPGHGNTSQAIEAQTLPPLELGPGRSGPVVEGVPGLGAQ